MKGSGRSPQKSGLRTSPATIQSDQHLWIEDYELKCA